MKYRLIMIPMALFWVNLLFAGNIESIFKNANEQYAAEDFKAAISGYQKILAQGYESSELYFNLGNCYFRLNNIGRAILNYERARRIRPHDADIRYNLELAQLRVVDRVVLPPKFFLFSWWENIRYYYSIAQLSNLMILLFILTMVLLSLWQLLRHKAFARLLRNISAVSGLAFLFAVYLFISRVHEYQTVREAVVLAKTVSVRSAPDAGSTDVFIIHEGTKVYLDNTREAWAKIHLPDGKEGWIEKSNFEEL